MTQSAKILLGTLLMVETLIFMGCEGGGGVKEVTTVNNKATSVSEKETSKTAVNSISNPEENLAQNHLVNLDRIAFGKQVSFTIDPQHEGGETWTPVWEENLQNVKHEGKNRIVQLSSTVLLYRRFPTEVAKDYYYTDQPDKIEFLDSTNKTIKVVDIWNNRPYQDVKPARLTYFHFDGEKMEMIPYKNQDKKITPTEYSLFTDVRSEGNHVIVNYELRSIVTTKSYSDEHSSRVIIGVKHTLYIYDLQGNLKYELKNFPSVDGAVVSNNGQYMMYTFGGIGLETANNPFGRIERDGWALIRLKDQKIVYQEYADDEKLAFNRLWKDTESDLLILVYSTPSDVIDYDYFIFFDEMNDKILKRKMPFAELKEISNYWKVNKKLDYRYHFNRFNFEQISVSKN